MKVGVGADHGGFEMKQQLAVQRRRAASAPAWQGH